MENILHEIVKKKGKKINNKGLHMNISGTLTEET